MRVAHASKLEYTPLVQQHRHHSNMYISINSAQVGVQGHVLHLHISRAKRSSKGLCFASALHRGSQFSTEHAIATATVEGPSLLCTT